MSALRRLPWPSFRLPVLVKDLTEQAAQRRTYIIRFAYGFVLFASSVVLFYANLGTKASARQTLGRGSTYFTILFAFQLAALYVVIPLLTAGSIAGERQRETLVLLLLSPLTPLQIVLQKFLSRMAPVLTFVFLSFPLLAITYTFGGVTVGQLLLGIALLTFVCLELGAFGILCSSCSATTAQALGATYVGSLLFPWVCSGVCCTLPVAALSGSTRVLDIGAATAAGFCLFSTVACLSLAEFVMSARVSASAPRNVPPVLQKIDRFFEAINRVVGGIVVWRDRAGLPSSEPIRWRETRKRSFGTARYLTRILLALELPVVILAPLIRLKAAPAIQDQGLAALLAMSWISAVLLVGVFAASIVSQERSRQTLIVLLTSPLSSRQILQQKLAGVDRLILVLLAPLVSLIGFQSWWISPGAGRYLLLALLTLVYLPCVKWLGTAFGLRMRTQLIAVVVTVSTLALWAAAPPVTLAILAQFQLDGPAVREFVLVLSPVRALSAIQKMATNSSGLPAMLLGSDRLFLYHFTLYAGLWFLLRQYCLRNLDRRLGRIPQPHRPAT